MVRVWVGGYGAGMEGDAEGIGLLEADGGAGTLTLRGTAVAASSPSWLAQHPGLDIVYAALEGDAAVQAFARSGETTLTPLGEPVPVGQFVCHLAVAPSGRYLIASCYGDGRVVRVGLDAAGRPVPDAADGAAALRAALFGGGGDDGGDGGDAAPRPSGDGAPATDPYADAAEDPRESHAHTAAFLPDGRIVTTDLGFDLVRFWRATGSGLELDHGVVLPKGTGPRHVVVHPSGHLHVVTEYSCEVFTLAAGPDGRWGVAAATTVAPVARVGSDFPAELSRSRDGETLYAGIRGSNTIAALRVRGSGEIVEPLALADSGVDWPRHHLVHEGALLVAGQRSNEVSVLDVDDRTGAPRGIRHRTPVPAPTHLLLAR